MENNEFYFVVREEIEDPPDGGMWATRKISISQHKLKDKKWVVNDFEKHAGITVVDSLDDLRCDERVVVIRGRFVTKDELRG